MQARYFDPIAARFLSADPEETNQADGGHFNRYDYVDDDPMDKTDPTGRTGIPFELTFQLAQMAQSQEAAAMQEVAYAEARAAANTYENRQMLYHSTSALATTCTLLQPEAAIVTGSINIAVTAVSLTDAGVHGHFWEELPSAGWALLPAGRAARLLGAAKDARAIERAKDVADVSFDVTAVARGVMAQSATSAAAAQGIAQSKGYDSAKVNSDGSVTVKVTQLGSRIPRKTTCTKDGCTK
jgi:hypothetical protein